MTRYIRPLTMFAMLAIIVAGVSGVAHRARAAIDESGKQRLETVFENLLRQIRASTMAGGGALIEEGDLLIEPAGTYYAVTLPHLALKRPDNSYTEIGMIAINAMPGAKEGQWKMTIALPTPITRFTADGVPAATIDLEGQNFVGIWDENVKNLIKANAQYKNIEIKNEVGKISIRIPNLTLFFDLQETGKDLWSGPATMTAENIEALIGKTGATARIKELKIDSSIRDYAPKETLARQEELNALLESYSAGDTPSISGAHAEGLFNLLTDMLTHAQDGYDMHIGVRDLALTRPPIPGSPSGSLSLDSAGIGFSLSGLRKNLAALGLSLDFSGLTLTPQPDETAKLIPQNLNFSLALNDLPIEQMLEKVKESIPGKATGAPQESLVKSLPELLGNTGSGLVLNALDIGNDTCNISTNAAFTADAQAKYLATGKLKADIFGLDTLIDTLGTAARQPDLAPDTQNKIQQALIPLTIVKMTGQMAKDDQGRDIRTYEIELKGDGTALLNGTDLGSLMQSLPAPQ